MKRRMTNVPKRERFTRPKGGQHESRTPKHRVGRPRANVDGYEVARLLAVGDSWRTIAKKLGVGTATAMRAYDAVSSVPKPSQNSQQSPRAPACPKRAHPLPSVD